MEKSQSPRHRSLSVDAFSSTVVYDKSGETYLSIIWCNERLGAAYYEADTAILYLLSDMMESYPFDLTKQLLEEINPVTIISSAKQDDVFLNALHKCSSSVSHSSTKESSSHTNVFDDISEENLPVDKSIKLISSVEFRYDLGKRKLLDIDLPAIPYHYTETERYMYLASMISFDDVTSIRAASGLIWYLDKKYSCEKNDRNIAKKLFVSCIKTFTLKNMVYMDQLSYCNLQVFQKVNHPSAYKQTSREGLSLFEILNWTTTVLGNKLLKSWFYRPTYNDKILKKRLDVVSYFTNPINSGFAKTIKAHLRQVKNLCRVVATMRASKLSVTEWVDLLKTLQSALGISNACFQATSSSFPDEIPPLFKYIMKWADGEIVGVVSMISNVIDVSASKEINRFVVLRGVSDVIDNMLDTYATLPEVLGELAEQEVTNYTPYISVCQIVYMRRIGYLLFTPKNDAMKESKSYEIPGMEFVALSNETVYYKTHTTRKLDERFGDILEDVAYQELEISSQLQNAVAEHASCFLDIMQHTAELDCLLSFATAAVQFDYIRPEITQNRMLQVLGSRHPLQERLCSPFAPNDIQFGNEHGFLKILTGPNASGKSVFLKQVGIIVYMAHIGSFVPAEKATIATVSSIYTMIRNPGSLSTSLSSFAHDLVRMSSITKNSNRCSLILIDEFGKGTAMLDGVSLLSSCLLHMIVNTDMLPMIICSTHFQRLVQNLLSPSQIVRYQIMETYGNGVDMTYLYQLSDGVCDKSRAFHVARAAGIPSELIKRGEEVCKIIHLNASVQPFNRASSITCQKFFDEVAYLALFCNLKDTSSRKQLLQNVRETMLKVKMPLNG
ncbi:unnamed protein product [Clavelina lepadiformis]|uniref:DNA mismatch repair proteins mutS family domain-containing protein n=1 Tax=Clavelina lepadiformis TaxID=159417 RepID=A0ABP0F9T3_CLALP